MGPSIVLDTNVLVAGLRSRRGASYRLLSRVGDGSFVACVSVGLVFEYEAVLKRPGNGLALTPGEVDDVLDYLVASSRCQEIHFLWRPTLRDPSDDMVLEVAVAAGAERIVTFNTRDFAGSEAFGVSAVTPGGFLAEMEDRS
jgi:putative PIN family toxin of toxin-antitoxin system